MDTSERRSPDVDDRRLWDVILGAEAYLALAVALDLGFFELIASRPHTLEEVCGAKVLQMRPAQALLSVLASNGLLHYEHGQYSLTALTSAYLIEASPTYLGGIISMRNANDSITSVMNLKNAVLTNSPQSYGGGDMFASHEKQASLARSFTNGMHSTSVGPSRAWPNVINLRNYRLMLDVGGGSGAHCIGAVKNYAGLQAIVLDIPPVCDVANDYIGQAGLSKAIRTIPGDMWTDPFPAADLHFYSSIFHDWPPDRCSFLARKSFESLPPAGRIIIHEMLLNRDKTGPAAVAALNITMLLWVKGQQYSGEELLAILDGAGFTEIQIKPTFGYWSIVTGVKQ
jgi:hypothetical protein